MRNTHMAWDDLRDGAKVETETRRSGYKGAPRTTKPIYERVEENIRRRRAVGEETNHARRDAVESYPNPPVAAANRDYLVLDPQKQAWYTAYFTRELAVLMRDEAEQKFDKAKLKELTDSIGGAMREGFVTADIQAEYRLFVARHGFVF